MLDSQPILTVRDPRDSFWQSTVERVARRHELATDAMRAKASAVRFAMPGGETSRYSEFVDLTNLHIFEAHHAAEGRVALGRALGRVRYQASAAESDAGPKAALDTMRNCALLAWRLAKAKIAGTAEEIGVLQDEFNFSTCDPFWAECIAEYEAHYHVLDDAASRPASAGPALPYVIPKNAVIAIVGDWGTGERRAYELLAEIKAYKPDILMHLGDVYYSGTRDEMQRRFLDVIAEVFGSGGPRVFTLCGNHDMYAGGAGYYWLVDEIGQGSSYFAIQNGDWQFVALDTGFNDRDPNAVNAAATYLELSDVEWVGATVAGAGDRNIVLFSHHPPFSAYEPIAGGAVNETLLSQLSPSLPKVLAWFWGHEHRLGIYDAYRGVARGRCLGHGAIPVLGDGQAEPIHFPAVPVHREGGTPLAMGEEDGFFKNGFGLMTLDGRKGRVGYYRKGETGPFWEESF